VERCSAYLGHHAYVHRDLKGNKLKKKKGDIVELL
jgi:hypothetical protein